MNASKFFISTASALMVVGGVGLAYAQTTPDSPATTPNPMTAPGGQVPAPDSAPANTATMPAASDSSATPTELPPQADRN